MTWNFVAEFIAGTLLPLILIASVVALVSIWRRGARRHAILWCTALLLSLCGDIGFYFIGLGGECGRGCGIYMVSMFWVISAVGLVSGMIMSLGLHLHRRRAPATGAECEEE